MGLGLVFGCGLWYCLVMNYLFDRETVCLVLVAFVGGVVISFVLGGGFSWAVASVVINAVWFTLFFGFHWWADR